MRQNIEIEKIIIDTFKLHDCENEINKDYTIEQCIRAIHINLNNNYNIDIKTIRTVLKKVYTEGFL